MQRLPFPARPRASVRKPKARLTLEALEDRAVPATWSVTTLTDTSDRSAGLSLRAEIRIVVLEDDRGHLFGRHRIVVSVLAGIDARKSQVVELRFFGGLTFFPELGVDLDERGGDEAGDGGE